MVNIAAPITFPDGVEQEKVTECEEYREMLTTMDLAATMHRDRPNTAIRTTAARLLKRYVGKRTRLILTKFVNNPMPSAELNRNLRALREAI